MRSNIENNYFDLTKTNEIVKNYLNIQMEEIIEFVQLLTKKENHSLEENKERLKKLLEQKKKTKIENLLKNMDDIMNNINNDFIKTTKEFIKLILRDFPYPGYNNEFNDSKIKEIFNKGNNEIKKFIRKIKIKYNPENYKKEY